MEPSTLGVVHPVLIVDDAEAHLRTFGQIGGLVENEAAIPHAGFERLLHHVEVYSRTGSSSKGGNAAAPVHLFSLLCFARSQQLGGFDLGRSVG